MVLNRSGLPFTRKRSTSHSRSYSETSSRSAAIICAFALILRAAMAVAAPAVGAETVGRGVRVALLDHDVVGRQPQFGRDDLRIGRLMALALRLRAHARDDRTGRVDADLRRVEHGDAQDIAVPRGTGADDLREEDDADAHQLAGLAALEGLLLRLLFLAQLVITDGVHRPLHGGVIVAGVVFPAERRLVGELLAPDEILDAQFRRIHAELLRQDVHGAL